jgi:hypothetical protein
MRRRSEKVVAVSPAIVFLAAATRAELPSTWVKAAGNSSTASESIVIEGSVSSRTINNTINKQDPAVLATLAKTFADQVAATTEAKGKRKRKRKRKRRS